MKKPPNLPTGQAGLTKQTKHKHVYDTYEGQRIRPDNKDYAGTIGDKALIYRVCSECKDKVAIDYLPTREAQIKLKELRAE